MHCIEYKTESITMETFNKAIPWATGGLITGNTSGWFPMHDGCCGLVNNSGNWEELMVKFSIINKNSLDKSSKNSYDRI